MYLDDFDFFDGVYVTVYFCHLTLQILVDWFKKFAYLMVENDRRAIRDREKIAFTLKKAIANDDFNRVKLPFLHAKGEFNVIQGIFDQKEGEVYDARVIKAGSVDNKIKEAHSYGRKEVALWI